MKIPLGKASLASMVVALGMLPFTPALAQQNTQLSQASAVSAMSPVLASWIVVDGSRAVGNAAFNTISGVVRGSAQLVVKAVNTSADGVAYVFEKAADGASAAVQFSANVAGTASVAVGQAVTASTVATGILITSAGQVIAFIPNALGLSLLHSERISQ